MRPEALAALRGVDHILHAGDIGAHSVIGGLRSKRSLRSRSCVARMTMLTGWRSCASLSEISAS
ncbi:MAG TPA: hypothetical protein VIO12_07545 [Thermoanaerobaculia bacterium]